MLSQSQINEFASVLESWQGAILDEWCAVSRRTTRTERLPPEVLADHLSALLNQLREFVLARDQPWPPSTRAVATYTFDRLARSIEVVDCVREMDELRLILMRRWWATRSRPDEIVLLMRAVDQLVREIVDTYSTLRRRTLAALDTLATCALEEMPRDRLLRRLLDTTADAVPDIEFACVFLIEDGRLQLRASLGTDDRHAVAHERFAGQVVATRVPTWSAAEDPQIRSTHSLYGLPLISGGELLGVVTVSASSNAQFPQLTQQLLRALSERAADVIAFDQRQRERERLTDRIEAQQRRLDAIVRTIPAGILIADAAGRVVQANDRARQVWGGDTPLVGMEDFGRYQGWWSHSGERLRAEDWALARAIRKGETSLGELIDIRRFDGKRATILHNGAPILDAKGHIVGGVVVFMDVSEQRRTARELERQGAEMSAIVDAIADGLVVYDSAGQIVRLNATANALLGFSEDEQRLPLGERMRLRSLVETNGKPLSPEQTPVFRALHGEVVKGEMLVVASGAAHRRWISASAAPVRLPSGEISGAVATFVEVTHLQEMRERMEDFVRMLSHDLRTPLATANLQAHLLTRTAESREAVHKRAQTIIRATSRMEHMIRDLVEATRLETGHHKVELRPVEVRPFFIELTQRLAGVMDVGRLRADIPADLPAIQADPDRLERIFVNLLSNALKYSPAESAVTIGARVVPDGVAISVRDRGQGIAADEVPHIFDRYFRAQHADRSKTEGLGLGLYITRLLVQAHGGRVTVESTPGQGSTFTVTLRTA